MKEYKTNRPLPRIKLAPSKPLTRKELDRRRHIVDSILKLRQEIGPIGIPAEELVRQVREEAGENG